jgi:hypothetical protein
MINKTEDGLYIQEVPLSFGTTINVVGRSGTNDFWVEWEDTKWYFFISEAPGSVLFDLCRDTDLDPLGVITKQDRIEIRHAVAELMLMCVLP